MKDRMLFNTCPESEFFGRVSEIEYIYRRATEERKPAPSIFLSAKRWMGKTEVLRRVHHNLFWGQARVVPVYYQFKGYGSLEDFSEDFLKEVLKQYLAFRKREPRLVTNEISIDKLEKLLVDNDLYDMADLISLHKEAKKGGDLVAALRNALSAPQNLTLRSGIPVYLILDDVDLASRISLYNWSAGIMKELMDVLNSGSFSFLAASSSKRILEGHLLNGSVESMDLGGLDEELSISMMMELCRQYNIEFETEILRLGAHRLEGNPMYIKNVVWAARRQGKNLAVLKEFADLYANELFDGNIAFALRSALQLKGLNDLRVLHACSVSASALSEEDLIERFRYAPGDLRVILEGLAASSLLEVNLGSIKWAGDNALRDFIYFVYETRVKGRSPEEVKTFIIREVLKEGFNFKSSKVTVKLKDEAAEILRSFNGQKMLKVLFRNLAFTSRFKNGVSAPPEKKDEEEVLLPQVVGCFDTLRWEANETGPPMLIAHGFQNSRYDAGNEVIWVTAVKETLAPVNLGDVENFLRRSLILKENFRSTRMVKWIIGKEGFTGEAQKRIDSEGIFSSDSAQLKIIKEGLQDRGPASGVKPAGRIAPIKEFEVVLPSSTKAELVAAKAVEEIGLEMGFDETAIGQIKAALVEACINAFEHSKVKSAKVFLRFVASADRLTIHVQNGGVDFDSPAGPPGGEPPSSMPRKRGWGFELMKGLMDEVRFEKIKGGAKIVLVKYLMKKGDSRDGQEV